MKTKGKFDLLKAYRNEANPDYPFILRQFM
jgi:hypothetical protein